LLNLYDRQAAQNPRAELPQSVQNAPELYLHLGVVWLVFNLVRNSRVMNEFGIGRIALAEMTCALDEFEVHDADLRVYYIRLLQDLDTTYVNHLIRQRK